MSEHDDRPVYVILGATGGIGSRLCRRLADDGARLVVGARTEELLAELAQTLPAEPYVLDAAVFDDVQGIVRHAKQAFGRLDGIANCVGSILLKPAHLTSPDEFDDVVSVNLRTAFNTVKAAARTMMADGGGAIVLCSSAVAETGIANHEAIAAAKSGINGLMRAAAATYAHRGVRVNCVAPGLVETQQSEPIIRHEAARTQSEAMHALGRLGTPDDVAAAIQWLLDARRSGWVTGQVLGVDGGLARVRPRPS